jgi:carbon-monoxide dehydrogenase iron sulfur subunit
MACIVEHSTSRSLFGSISEKPLPIRRVYVEKAEGQNVPLVCRHCMDAPCVAVCRTGALFQDPVTGIVDRNIERCVGCWMCAMTCPYGVIGRQAEVRVAVKCDRCKDLDQPACVRACPTGALVFATQGEFMEMMRKAAATRIAREALGLARA